MLRPSKAYPEHWRNLGSSKSRTIEQEIMSRKIITDAIRACGADTTICFTDGSCLGNPRPCGAGSCISFPGSVEPVCWKKPVSKCGSVLLGELVAIQMSISYIHNHIQNRDINVTDKVHIFSDSQSAVGLLTLGLEAKNSPVDHQRDQNRYQQTTTRRYSSIVSLDSWTFQHTNECVGRQIG